MIANLSSISTFLYRLTWENRTSRLELSAGRCSPICTHPGSCAAVPTLNHKEDDESFSSAALKERRFVQPPDIVPSCVAQGKRLSFTVPPLASVRERQELSASPQRKWVPLHYRLEAGDAKVPKTETSIWRTPKNKHEEVESGFSSLFHSLKLC